MKDLSPSQVDGPTSGAVAPPASSLLSPNWRVVLALALPVLAQQGLIMVVNLSDRFLAGHFEAVSPQEHRHIVGYHALSLASLGNALVPGPMPNLVAAAATWELAGQIASRQIAYQSAQTTANYLAWFISSYTVLVSVASTALVARFMGARDRLLAVHVTHQSILLAVGLGALASVAALSGGIDVLVLVLQLRGEPAQFAAEYLRPLFAMLVFHAVESAGIACLVGAGDTRTGLWVMIGVALVNLPLAWGLCFGLGPFPPLGFVGISLGTALSHTLGSVVVLAVLFRGRYGLKLNVRDLRPRWDLMARLLRIGVPAGLDSMSVVVGQFWFLSIVNRLGEVASSAHGIAISWEALGFLSGTAFGTAAMTLVGHNLGAGRPDLAARSGWLACGLGCGVMCCMGAIFYTLAPWMFALFCPLPAQRPIIDAGVPVLRLVAFAMAPLAPTIIFTSALRGAGDTRVPVLFTWIGFFLVRIPLAYFLALPVFDLGPFGTVPGLGLGLYGAWLAMFADLVVRGAFFLLRFAFGPWHRIRV